MPTPFLLSRVLLRFNDQSDDLLGQLSCVTLTPDGSLWVGSDELNTIERLSPVEPHIFASHQPFAINDFIPLVNQEEEIDIEGMGYFDSYLWLIGSHSRKRGKPKGKNLEKDIRKLAEIKPDPNRYLIARIPVVKGELHRYCSHPENIDQTLTAACLQLTESGNLLMDALSQDIHLGPYISMALPSKENGFDIEGLAVHKNKLFLGLRGPVLRGWAIILEIEVAASEPGILTLKPISEDGQEYKKHFVNLNGLGIREICFCKKDLIILAGPTMEMEGAMQVFRLKNVLNRPGDSLIGQTSDDLEALFDLPFTVGSDHAEGLSIFPCLGQKKGLLVVYDAPDAARRIEPNAIFADVFRLE
jgi:hypothetical protein